MSHAQLKFELLLPLTLMELEKDILLFLTADKSVEASDQGEQMQIFSFG